MHILGSNRPREGLPSHILVTDQQEREGIRGDDMALARRMADLLTKSYPGYPWMVRVMSAQGVATVNLLAVPGYERFAGLYAYVLHLDKDIYSDPNLKSVTRAGGELLERWGLPRNQPFSLQRWMNAKPLFADIKSRMLREPIRAKPKLLGADGLPLAGAARAA